MSRHVLIFLAGAATFGALSSLVHRARRPASRASAGDHVRNAGPSEMRDPPRNWSRVDEQGDESFPASDPPGNY
ncbi:hypothetical protein [Anianabacter salinae]|uniref:hypothetical protein n=1 Tax=Anianabacter salinae TaxID=2851023 RepID=UPI00225E51B3|nr:hypothetical protein [Anianabacter salinae]MBV0913201.1 hypothetical protein [Anianabacter salinae]